MLIGAWAPAIIFQDVKDGEGPSQRHELKKVKLVENVHFWWRGTESPVEGRAKTLLVMSHIINTTLRRHVRTHIQATF